MSNYADASFDRNWHHGEAQDFSSPEQALHWRITLHFLETGLDLDYVERPSAETAIVEFMQRQTSPILPGLSIIIGRLLAGEAFAREADGWLMRLKPPGFHLPRGNKPDPIKEHKIKIAAYKAERLMEQRVKVSAAKAEAAKEYGLKVADVHAVLELRKPWTEE
jgi:hypothetical protein